MMAEGRHGPLRVATIASAQRMTRWHRVTHCFDSIRAARHANRLARAGQSDFHAGGFLEYRGDEKDSPGAPRVECFTPPQKR